MEDNNKNIRTAGWKADALPIPEPIEVKCVNADDLILKRGDEDDKRV